MNHKFLSPDATHADEAGYSIEDGIVVDIDSRPNARKVYDEWTRYWAKTPAEKQAEEAAWAARSGPVTIINPGRKAS